VIEVGYVPFDPEAVALFFELVSSRYDRTSMIVSPNKTSRVGPTRSGGGRTGPAAGDPVQRRRLAGADSLAREGSSATSRDAVRPVTEGLHPARHPDGSAETYSLTHAKSALEDADWISGDYRTEGVIVAAGPNVRAFDQLPLLIDLAPTILAALDAPSQVEHTGRVLHELMGSDAKVGRSEPKPGRPDHRHADRRGVLERQRHRGRRDGGPPPRPWLPLVAVRITSRGRRVFHRPLPVLPNSRRGKV
jgi:hypothetical protein